MADGVEIKETITKLKCFLLLGPPFVLLSFAICISGLVFKELIIYRTCLLHRNNNATECFMSLVNATDPESINVDEKVEPYVSMILMVKSLTQTLVPAVLSLFLGPWSDRKGRKPLLLASFAGCSLSFFALSLLCNLNIRPWYLLLVWIPQNIVGGIYTAVLASVCYISDTTTEKYRMMQLSLLQASICAGDLLGALVGPLIYVNLGYANVFRAGAIASTSALVYIYCLIPESVKKTSKKSRCGLLIMSSVKEIIISSCVKGDGFLLAIVWLAISTITLSGMNIEGYLTIEFLFARVRLGWDVQRYAYFDATSKVLRIIGLCGVSLLDPTSGASNILLAGIACASALGGAITKSFTWKSWHMYLSACIEIFGGIILPVMQSIISKFVPAEDVGKVLSLSAFLEASSPSVGAPLYTLIYSHFLPPIYPSPVFLLSSSLNILSLIFVISIGILLRKSRKLPIYVAASQDDKT